MQYKLIALIKTLSKKNNLIRWPNLKLLKKYNIKIINNKNKIKI